MKVLIPTAALLAATLCATAIADPSGVKPPGRHNACFWTREINNFAATDDRTLYLRVGVRDVYQVNLFSPCLDIAWAHHLAIRSRGSSVICEGSNLDAEVIAPETGIGHQRCQVTTVRKLTPEEAAALPKGARP
jgi:hypothetical protein